MGSTFLQIVRFRKFKGSLPQYLGKKYFINVYYLYEVQGAQT